MNKNYVISFIIFSVLSWIAWILVIMRLSPFEYPEIALISFFLTLFIALLTTFSLILFFIRKLFLADYEINGLMNISIRQGVLLSLLVVFALSLMLMNVLNFWTGFLLILLVLAVEIYLTRDIS